MGTGGERSAGFTIVETIIVLAVSSMLATSAMLLVSGRQNKTMFQVASNNLKQQLEQIINETASGFYPNNNDFSCQGSTGGQPVINTDPVSYEQQGKNNSCIFLGKALAFGIDDPGSKAYIVYPLIGNRTVNIAGGIVNVSNFDEAKPIALAPDTSGTPGRDYSTVNQTENGLSFKGVLYTEANGAKTSKTYAVFAFADQLGHYTANPDASLSSATQQLELFDYNLPNAGWPNSAPNDSPNTVNFINGPAGIDTAHDITSVALCFASGTTEQSALYTISGHGQLAVTMKIYGDTTCGP
jgi:type II secretory pathway pseudopilin PulG